MGVSWTKEQQQVIDLRKRNILVSAAAGSGKTAVLVERIITMITDPKNPVDIDRLLIVTFTNAAAAEMRERIGNAIEKALEENPESEHLQRQLTLIHNAQITTIDSFCLFVIRNHFHEIDLEPNFRIGDEGELKLLKEDVINRLLEENYENLTPEYQAFVEGYASGRTDNAVRDMVLQLFEFSKSYPWPEKWLKSCAKNYAAKSIEALNEAEWMYTLVENIHAVISDCIHIMEEALELSLADDGPHMYEKAVRSDLEKYKKILEKETLSDLYEVINGMTYDRLAGSRGFEGDVEKLERVKNLRDMAKEAIKKISKQYFFCSPTVMLEQLQKTEPMVEELVRLTIDFSKAYAEEKKKKNLVDFHDLEHFALEILVDEETEKAKKTAEEFQDAFEEIMIDEYQDSNNVQEAILTAVSRQNRGENNIFMVGDVKQSIYRFRLARPELFMDKYDHYSLEDSATQRIDLHKNFRSRNEVLECTNDIFYKIMARDLGNVEYNNDAALYPGADYQLLDQFSPEILLVDSSEELLEDTEYTDKKILEAKMVAERIKELMKHQLVTDKETRELRPVCFSDIVILLRSLNGWADSFMSVLNDSGIPAHTVSSTGYFSAIEVQTVLCMLHILDNPRQDIPLTAVLRSPIAGFGDEELAHLRLLDKEIPFHECVLMQMERLLNEETGELEKETPENQKLFEFAKLYQKLRQLVPDTPIHELIEIILRETGYDHYAAAMPAGRRRLANLEMLMEKAIAYENTSYKGLFHFTRYIEELQKYDVDFGEADMVGESEDVVRIMSIHKSKGLEFPVVFVSGLGKKFNRQDVRSRMVLHPELGIGLDALDGIKRIKSPTIAKRAIAKKIDLENLGEELRVLYVALTRAKEKLILTGNLKDAEEKVGKFTEKAAMTAKLDKSLPYMVREGATTYLEWVLPALASYGDKYPVSVVSAAALVTEEMEAQIENSLEKEECLKHIQNASQEMIQKIEEQFSKKYPYVEDLTRKNKYSVSELKHRAMRELFEQEEEDSVPAFIEEEEASYVPDFIKEAAKETIIPEVNQGALRGTAVHRVMECYDFTSEAGAVEQIRNMLKTGELTQDMADLVKTEIIEEFVTSEVGIRMAKAQKAGTLYKEKPFVMGYTKEELDAAGFGEESEFSAEGKEMEDLTLIQGIIDVFWIEEDGITLLDYKTDKVETGQELADRYRAQILLYEDAINRIFSESGRKVKEKLLYSFRLKEFVKI